MEREVRGPLCGAMVAPKGDANPIVEIDAVQGGHWRISQRDPEGNEFSFYGVFTEVVPLVRTVQSYISGSFPAPHRPDDRVSRNPCRHRRRQHSRVSR